MYKPITLALETTEHEENLLVQIETNEGDWPAKEVEWIDRYLSDNGKAVFTNDGEERSTEL